MNSKQWAKVQVVKSTMTLKITKQIYNTKSEGLQMMGGKPSNYQILNNKGIDALVASGYKIFGKKEEIRAVDLTGNPEVEEQIRQYYVKKMEKKGMRFVKNANQHDAETWNQSQISHEAYQAKLSAESALNMKKTQDKAVAKYYKNRKVELNV